MKLSLGKNQVRVRLALVANSGVARTGGPEVDDFDGSLDLARGEREGMAGVGDLGRIQREDVRVRVPGESVN